MPFYVLDNSLKPARAGVLTSDPSQKSLEQETACAWRMEHLETTQNQEALVFQIERAKTSLIVAK